MMRPNNRDILVRNKWMTEEELAGLNQMLQSLDNPEIFCRAHELAERHKITNKKERILKECRYFYLRPFRFLINKN